MAVKPKKSKKEHDFFLKDEVCAEDKCKEIDKIPLGREEE